MERAAATRMRSKGTWTVIRKLGAVERQAIRLVSEAVDVPILTRKRARAILLAEDGIQVTAIAGTVGLAATDVLACLADFEQRGMHALYG